MVLHLLPQGKTPPDGDAVADGGRRAADGQLQGSGQSRRTVWYFRLRRSGGQISIWREQIDDVDARWWSIWATDGKIGRSSVPADQRTVVVGASGWVSVSSSAPTLTTLLQMACRHRQRWRTLRRMGLDTADDEGVDNDGRQICRALRRTGAVGPRMGC
ncbi:hypothetical protein ACLOJK_020733 [Asimina triloba]